MNTNTVLLLKVLVGSIAVLNGIAAAGIGFWASTRTKSQRVSARDWFQRKWSAVNESHWLTLPERIIIWLVRLRARLPAFLQTVLNPSDRYSNWIIIYVFLTSCLLLAHLPIRAPALLIYVWLAAVFLGSKLVDWFPDFFESSRWFRLRWLSLVLRLLGLFGFGIITILSVLAMPVFRATLWMVYLLPFFFSGSLIALSAVWSDINPSWRVAPFQKMILMRYQSARFQEHFILFSFAFAVSLSLTQVSLFVGHMIRPGAWVPQTVQMFISNGVFDSLTVITTLRILERATRPSAVLLAVALSLVLTSVLACGSLFCGLAFTDRYLTLAEVARVLVARSVDDGGWEVGPYFWVMHSTFIPVFGYMGIVLMSWLAKLTLVIYRWILGKGAHEDIDALAMTSRLLGLVASIFSGLYFVISL